MPSTQPSNPHAASAEAAGLEYLTDATPGIRRKGSGTGFAYYTPDGALIRDRAERRRIQAMAIPPAWTDVWICPNPLGHLQVTARDAKGRKQYRYHPLFRELRDESKFGRMLQFSELLPALREQVERDLAVPGLPRRKVLATVVRLLDKTLIRIGNDEYARTNRSYGLTTLRRHHVEVSGDTVRFAFRGKSGVDRTVKVTDRRLARIIQQCQDMPGYELFKYVDDDGKRQSVSSGDINDYLRELTGHEITAKDFRTWSGTMYAARALRDIGLASSEREAKSNVVKAIDQVARRLGNTRSVCRKYYVHPAVINAYLRGSTISAPKKKSQKQKEPPKRDRSSVALRQDETMVLQFLLKEIDGDRRQD